MNTWPQNGFFTNTFPGSVNSPIHPCLLHLVEVSGASVGKRCVSLTVSPEPNTVCGMCQDRHQHHHHPSLNTSVRCTNSSTGTISLHHHDPLQQVPLLPPGNGEGKAALETLMCLWSHREQVREVGKPACLTPQSCSYTPRKTSCPVNSY